jgi:leucyl aminopeptidase (aminopeptidase T)
VLVVTDGTCDEIAEAFRRAALALASSVDIAVIPVAERNGQEPPAGVARRMRSAHVVLMPVARSLSWTRARMDATDAGARIASMGNIDAGIILRTFTLDYDRIRRRVNALCDLLDAAKKVRVTSALGTDLVFDAGGREAHGRKGGVYCEPGHWGNLPCGEAFIAPVEGTASGVYVVDASHAGVGKLETPVRVTVESGRAVGIEGRSEATSLRGILGGVGDDRAFNIAEFGIGCNDGAQITGVTLEDEKVLGTCHVALGHNAFFGGSVEVGVHVDGVIRSPTVALDGREIMKDGKVLLEEFRD